MEEKNKTEGGSKEEKKETDDVNVTSSDSQDNSDVQPDDQKTVEEIDEEVNKDRKIKNLTAAIIVLSGIVIGSIFVDVVQLANGGGYSERALKDSEVFVAGDKTWVAYPDPTLEVTVLTVDGEEMESCENCDPTEVLVWLKRFMPTMVTKKVTVESEEGQAMINKYQLKTVPSFVFAKDIEEAEFFQEEARVLFEEQDDRYVLNATGLGIPVGKYLETPEISEADAILGSPDAKVKIIVFSDHQCPFCSKYFDQVTAVAGKYGDKVALVFKDLPLDFHPQAQNAALAARCAQEQDKYWEMAKKLYSSQDEWGKTEGISIFKTYAATLNISASKFNQCMDEKKYAKQIQSDFEEGRSYGISGTPSTFINGEFVSGLLQEGQLEQMIEEELAKQ